MFGFDWSELMIIVVVALIVLGPKDLPRALYQLGKCPRHARRITGEFQRHVDDIVRQAELEEVRKTVQDAAKTMDVRGQVAEHVNTVLDPVKDIKQAFDKAAPGATPSAAGFETSAMCGLFGLRRSGRLAPGRQRFGEMTGGAVTPKLDGRRRNFSAHVLGKTAARMKGASLGQRAKHRRRAGDRIELVL